MKSFEIMRWDIRQQYSDNSHNKPPWMPLDPLYVWKYPTYDSWGSRIMMAVKKSLKSAYISFSSELKAWKILSALNDKLTPLTFNKIKPLVVSLYSYAESDKNTFYFCTLFVLHFSNGIQKACRRAIRCHNGLIMAAIVPWPIRLFYEG